MPTDQIPSNEHFISLDRAIEMTTRYRENKEKILSEEFKNKDILPIAETFNKQAFTSFFTNPACTSIRIYYGMSDDLQTHAIVVGVNDKNEDILPGSSLLTVPDPPVIVEDAYRCPPICSASPLNPI